MEPIQQYLKDGMKKFWRAKDHPWIAGRSLACLVLIFLWFVAFPIRQAQASAQTQIKGGGPYAVIDAVNAVRAANGLAPFQVNAALMAAAQAHSEYQASIGSTTHTGRGGSDVKSRAVAAGYGGGANVSVIENVYGGMNATPQQAVNWWKGDGVHLNTLLSTRHTDVGAGVAVSDSGVVYYTLDVGGISGSGSAAGAAATGPGQPGAVAAASSTEVAFAPILVSTPEANGAVIHVVQPGQTLWAISATYGINILELLSLNGLNANAYIVPGQKIVIRPAGSMPTATAAPKETTEKHTRTPRPSATPTQAATTVANLLPTQSMTDTKIAQASTRNVPNPGVDLLLVAIIGLMVGGVVLVVAGNVIKRAG
jgi:LysM repeat protein